MTNEQSVPKVRSADLWTGAVVIAAGAVGLGGSLSILDPPGMGGETLGPRDFPLTVSVLLMVLGAALAMRALLTSSVTRVDLGRARTCGAIVATIIGFIVLFEPLGFLPATFLLLAALYRYLGERRLWLIVLVAAVIAVGIYIGFGEGLNVALPVSPFGF